MKHVCVVLLLATSVLASAGEFEGDLILKDVADQHVNTGPNDPGHTEFELLVNYSYRADDGSVWTAAPKTVVNGASIPEPAWSVIGGPWSGKYRNAAVIHDWMCDKAIRSSIYTHRIFYEAMLSSGVSKLKAATMYYAVLKGGPEWEEGAGFLPEERGLVTKDELEKFQQEVGARAVEEIPASEIEQRVAEAKARELAN